MGAFLRRVVALALAAGAAFTSAAQEPPALPTAPLQTPILTIDQDRLFEGSLWGKRVAGRIEAASAALSTENRRIEADLTLEERALTEQRPTLPAEEFRKLADDFDARVTEFRRAQDSKARAITRILDIERQAFFTAALPVMAEVLRGHGAIAVLDNRAIFLAADAIDATDEMILRIDTEIGVGADVAVPEEAAGDEPAPEGAAAPLAAPAPPVPPGSGN